MALTPADYDILANRRLNNLDDYVQFFSDLRDLIKRDPKLKGCKPLITYIDAFINRDRTSTRVMQIGNELNDQIARTYHVDRSNIARTVFHIMQRI